MHTLPVPPMILTAPGVYANLRHVYQTIALGRQIRDEFLWQYPILPGAFYTYQQMASSREWRISGSLRGVARAYEWIQDATSINTDGTVEYGFEQFLKRRVADYLCIGRTMYTWDEGKPLRYLDPSDMIYNFEDNSWIYNYTGERFPANRVNVHHPIPLGNNGYFVSPLSFVIPTAMLAWLIREHDKAAADGRKIRDIILTVGKELAEQMVTAVQDAAKLWSGANVNEFKIPIVHSEYQQGLNASDMVTRIGLANIPPGFDRAGFQFEYVNEIAASLGIALRHFWNSEKATNRALEEVQEARQAFKGPSVFVRSEQRGLNQSGSMRQFGPRTRFGFMEEVDLQSQKTRAEVLKLYADAASIFNDKFEEEIDGAALLAWLQSENILPPDLKISKKPSEMMDSDSNSTPKEGETIEESDKKPSTLERGFGGDLDYDEVTINWNGQIVERRLKVFTVEKMLEEELLRDTDFVAKTIDEHIEPSFKSALAEGRKRNLERFWELEKHAKFDDETAQQQAQEIYEKGQEGLSDDDHRMINMLLKKVT